ncbi:hypothetical protein E2C01_064421 [Portunus trituberculatus]|uniref:Uncharacterized protein n=1 Tax=Portunus trituberculatus TaxID=210409 RepID=A0A5B7HCZ2_PORTR|nr:hypothetical protein [Portunus trituberculatus]
MAQDLVVHGNSVTLFKQDAKGSFSSLPGRQSNGRGRPMSKEERLKETQWTGTSSEMRPKEAMETH